MKFLSKPNNDTKVQSSTEAKRYLAFERSQPDLKLCREKAKNGDNNMKPPAYPSICKQKHKLFSPQNVKTAGNRSF